MELFGAGPSGEPGLWVASLTEHPLAQQLGMTVSRERRSALPPDSAVYLTGMDYIPTIERAQGADYDPEAWLSMLLCQFTREEHLRALAAVNHIAQHADMSAQFQEQVLTGTHPLVSGALTEALAGNTPAADGQPRVFLARHLVLRAIRLVSHLSPIDDAALSAAEVQTGQRARAFDPLLCAVFLTHAIGDGMGAHTSPTPDEVLLGGIPERLALELICSGSFSRQGNHGNLLARTLLDLRDLPAQDQWTPR